MRNIAICGAAAREAATPRDHLETFRLDDVDVLCGLIHTTDPTFDRALPLHRHAVLVRVRAFSCNYRDKGIILSLALRGPDNGYITVGSEFVGEVVDVGPAVTGFTAGDRVIGNGTFPERREGVHGGLPTNHASRELIVVHEAKLMKIPARMPDAVAAAFSVGAQTTFGMLRRLGLRRGANVLVTAARSNTSLFVISALRHMGVNVFATTTSDRSADELARLGVKELVKLDDQGGGDERIRQLGLPTRGFDAIIDPFSDIHFRRLCRYLVQGGTYVTCGIGDQTSRLRRREPEKWDAPQVLSAIIFGNVQLMGNCLGSSEDLADAIAAWEQGALEVVVDSTFGGRDVAAFFQRTFQAPDRFGKVVFQYGSAA